MVDSKAGQAKPLVISIVGPLMNKVKMSMLSAKKNQLLAQKLNGTMCVLSEQLLPQFLSEKINDYEEINNMHNLCYLLAMKTQQVFNSRIIHTCIDQNWDLKGFKQVLVRILRMLGCSDYDEVTSLLDFTIKTQNLQSSSCIKAIGSFIRNSKKPINEDDLGNPVDTYETQFEFLKADIQQYRAQRIKHECFSVLHPWAYDLDKVDFKYIMNNDLTQKVCNELRTQNAQVFWLTFFKSQAAVSADDFFGALRELANLNKIPQFYEMNLPEYQRAAIASDFVFSLGEHAENITVLVQQVVDAGSRVGYNALQDQIKSYTSEFDASTNKIGTLPSGVSLQENPRLHQFMNDRDLGAIRMRELSPSELEIPVDLQRATFEALPDRAASHKLHMKFEAVDTEELKNLEISVDGTRGIFKVGEGEANHYQIPNDKKLWESQLMIVCKDGKYYIRDLGIVHTSRIKVDMNTSIQIQQDALIDLGKVVHYHFDKVTYMQNPSQEPTPSFFIMRPNANDYAIEEVNDGEQDPPTLRARPTWVSSDENKDLIQKEIILEALEQQPFFSIGRSMKREVQIKLKAVSADHCNITYDQSKGWFISESGKDKASSNGTFVFMKSQKQMQDHEPSSLIPLHDGMVISFINYEIRVNLERKDADKVAEEDLEIRQRSDALQQTANMAGTMPAQVAAEVQEETQPAQEEVTPQAEPEAAQEEAQAEEEHHVVVAQEEQSIHGGDSDKEDAKVDEPAGEVAQQDTPVEEAKTEEAQEAKAEEPEAEAAQAAPEEAPATENEAAPAEEPKAEEAPAAEAAPAEEPKAEEAPAAEAAPAEEAKAEEAPVEEAKAEEAPAAEEPKAEEAPAAEAAPAEEPKAEEAPAAEAAPAEEAKAEEAPAAEAAPAEEAKSEAAPAEEAKAEEAPAAEAAPAEDAKSDKDDAAEVAPAQEAKAEEAPAAEAAPAEEAKAEEAPAAEAAPAEEAKSEAAPAEEAKAEEAPAAEAAPAEEPKAEAAPAEEAKSEAAPAEAAPAEAAPAEEAKAEASPAAEAAPAEEAKSEAAPAEEAKAEAAPAEEAKADDAKADAKAEEAKSDAAPAQAAPAEEAKAPAAEAAPATDAAQQ